MVGTNTGGGSPPENEPGIEIDLELELPGDQLTRVTSAASAAPGFEPTRMGATQSTRVDLGEDLLAEAPVAPVPERMTETDTAMTESATVIAGAAPASAEPSPLPARAPQGTTGAPSDLAFDPDDQLLSARILVREGLSEEAKKILRRILIRDANQLGARELLDEIHATELKQIFKFEPARKARPNWGSAPAAGVLVPDPGADDGLDPERTFREMDRDLRLGLLREMSQNGPRGPFESDVAYRSFLAKLDRQLAECDHQDRIDLGIAFLEMGLADTAAHVFSSVFSYVGTTPEAASPDLILSSAALLARALLECERPFEAISALQRALTDVEIPRERKVELLYLMGRAYEELGRLQTASSWYVQAAQIDPQYRDLQDRIRRAGARSR